MKIAIIASLVLACVVLSAGAFNPNPNAQVWEAFVLNDGKIIISGYFTNVNGQAAYRNARLYPNGTVDTNYTFYSTGWFNAALRQADGKYVVGGDFSEISGKPRYYVARLDVNGDVDNVFTNGVQGVGRTVYSLAAQADGKVLVGGIFNSLGGYPRSCIGRLNANGSVDTTFATNGADRDVYGMAQQNDGKILVGGYFTNYLGGHACTYFGRLDSNGLWDASFTPNADG